MDTGERRSQTKLGEVATALAVVVLIVASCSGAATSAPASAAPASAPPASAAPASVPATGSKAAAQSIVAGFLGPVKFVSPGPAINISKFKGKSIWIISADLSIPFHQNIIKGWEEAATAAGEASYSYYKSGQLLAAYAIANNDGPVHGVFMDTSEYKEVAFEKKGYFDT